MTMNSKHRTEKLKPKKQRYRDMKNQNTESLVLPKENVKMQTHKPVLNKTLATREQCIKYNFVAPLRKDIL